jgi:hypothetical protein
VNDVRQMLNQLGVTESDQAGHLERIIESPMKLKRDAPIVQINFNDKAESILKMLRKASMNIYKKNIVESIESEKKQKEELKDVRDRIMKKKKRKI